MKKSNVVGDQKKSLILLVLIISILSLQNVFAETNESLSIDIISPESKTYDNEDILLDITTNKESKIDYVLNDESFTGCNNCTSFIKDLNLTEGNYNLIATAFYGNETTNETANKQVNFSVDLFEEFVLTVNSPESKIYNTTIINIDIETSLSSDLSYILDDGNETSLCNNCTSFTTSLNNVSEGNHTIKFMAVMDNKTLSKEINFEVNLENEEETEEPEESNETTSRFSNEFSKLPKDFASGLISKAELINILENNQIPPGHINRLLKTGLLDKEIIDKIIETQDLQPYGIYRRLNAFLNVFGYYKNPLVENLFEYNLTENQTSNLLKEYKVPKKVINKVIKEEKLSQKNKEVLAETQEIKGKAKEKLIDEGNKKVIEKINNKEKNKNLDKSNKENSGKSKNK